MSERGVPPHEGRSFPDKSLTSNCELKLVEVLARLRDWLQASEELRAALDEYITLAEKTVQAQEWLSIEYKGKLYGRIVQDEASTTIIPVESLPVKAEDPAITRFLIPRVLERFRQKHGFNYTVQTKAGLLDAITIKARLDGDQLKEITNAVGWAFEKATNRGGF